jgi:hypothetical protein
MPRAVLPFPTLYEQQKGNLSMYEAPTEAAAQTQQVPPEVYRLAIASNMGPLQHIYYGRRATLWYRATGIICLLVGALLTALFSDISATLFVGWSLGQSVFVLVLGLAWISIGIWLMITSFLKRRRIIFVYVHGLIVQQRAVEALRWEHITRLWKKVQVQDTQSNDSAHYTYTVQRADGTRFVFGNDIPAVEVLGQQLEEQVTRHLLPLALTSFQTGAAISFGSLTVNRQGIETRRQALTWPQVKHVYIDDVTTHFYKKGETAPAITLASARIANLAVLKGLLDYVRLSRASAPEAAIERMYLLFQAGLPLKFGVLGISSVGVTVRDEIRLPWTSIASIALEGNEVVIEGKDGGHLQSIPLEMIGDISGLKALLSALAD